MVDCQNIKAAAVDLPWNPIIQHSNFEKQCNDQSAQGGCEGLSSCEWIGPTDDGGTGHDSICVVSSCNVVRLASHGAACAQGRVRPPAHSRGPWGAGRPRRSPRLRAKGGQQGLERYHRRHTGPRTSAPPLPAPKDCASHRSRSPRCK